MWGVSIPRISHGEDSRAQCPLNIKQVTKLGQNAYKEHIYSVPYSSSQEIMSWAFINLKKLMVFPVQFLYKILLLMEQLFCSIRL